MREAWVRGLGQEYPLEKEMAIYSSTLAWKIPCTEEPGRLQPKGSQRVGHDQATSLSPCLVLQKNSKIVLCESLEVEPGPCPKAILLFLDCPSLVSLAPFSVAALWPTKPVLVYGFSCPLGGSKKGLSSTKKNHKSLDYRC